MKYLLLPILLILASCNPVFAAKTTFTDGNAKTKTPGTKVTAAFLNAVNTHRHDGQATDGSGALDYATAGGSANALTATLPKALPALITGMPINIKATFSNTSSATLNLNATGVKTIKKLGGQNLAANDIQATQIIQVAYDGTAFQLLSYNSPPVTDASTLQGHSAAQLVPPGAIMDFAAPSVPAGWLLCDGRAVLRAQYPALFTYIGTTWGAGDGTTTFNLPDFRGEFRRGWDNGRGLDSGRAYGSLQLDSLKAHVHTGGGWGYTDGDTGKAGTGAASLQTTWTTNSTGDIETRPRNLAVLPCIKY